MTTTTENNASTPPTYTWWVCQYQDNGARAVLQLERPTRAEAVRVVKNWLALPDLNCSKLTLEQKHEGTGKITEIASWIRGWKRVV
jgi:hypothetical protein